MDDEMSKIIGWEKLYFQQQQKTVNVAVSNKSVIFCYTT